MIIATVSSSQERWRAWRTAASLFLTDMRGC